MRPLRLLLFAIVPCLGCGSSLEEVNPGPASMDVFPAGPLIVRRGDVVPLSFAVRDRNGHGLFPPPIELSSSASKVATAASTSIDSYALTAGAPGTAVITAITGNAVTRLTVTVTDWPRTAVSGGAFGAAARGGTALVTTLDGHLLRLDAASGAVAATYDYYSTYVAFSNDGTRAFFGNSVFDLASATVVRPLVTDANNTCGDIAAARERPQGSIMYLGCTVGVVAASTATGDVVNTFSTPFPVNSLTLHPTDPRLYAAAPTAGRVYELSTETGLLVRELPILGGPQTAVLPGGGEIDVAMEGEHQIERWDLTGPTETDSLTVRPLPNGAGPFDLEASNDGTRLLASAGSFVVELDRATLTATKTYWVGGTARRIGVADGVAVVANEGGWVDILPF